jgi:hypothetical protein
MSGTPGLLSPEVEFAAHCLNGCLDEVGDNRSVPFDGLPGRRLIRGLVDVHEKVRQTSEARASVRIRAAGGEDDVAARDTVSKKGGKKESNQYIFHDRWKNSRKLKSLRFLKFFVKTLSRQQEFMTAKVWIATQVVFEIETGPFPKAGKTYPILILPD